MQLSLSLALSWLSQARCECVQGVVADRVHTDSRSLQAGDLFVALRGERFDGNQFIAQAKAQGAVAVVCELQARPRRWRTACPRWWCPMRASLWVSWRLAGVHSSICQ
jgi:UDP-N-acetylmuramyl pentapeptide synthase